MCPVLQEEWSKIMKYPFIAAEYIKACDSTMNEEGKELVRAVACLINTAYADGYAAGKEASRHE